jgi:ubiquinone/menaquinone biosynthesis C-methylase UbiE
MTVLDLGCGPGFFTIEMARITGHAGKVVAADLQEGMLEIVQKKIKKYHLTGIVELHKCSERKIGLELKFDFILIFYMLHEAPDQPAFLNEVYSLLNTDGKVLLVEPTFHVSKKEFDQLKEKLKAMKYEIAEEPRILLCRSYLLKKQEPRNIQ